MTPNREIKVLVTFDPQDPAVVERISDTLCRSIRGFGMREAQAYIRESATDLARDILAALADRVVSRMPNREIQVPATPEDIHHGAFRLVECADCGVFKAVKPVKPDEAAMRAAEDWTENWSIGDTCCGKCPGDTCYVDQVTGA